MIFNKEVKGSKQYAIYNPEQSGFYIPSNVPSSGYFSYLNGPTELFSRIADWTPDIHKCYRFDSQEYANRHVQALQLKNVRII